jgi:hypothetical protein
MAEKWNPRGPQTWPEWREAKPGVTRVEHVRTGWRGTFVRWPRTPAGRNPGYAVIDWDAVKIGSVERPQRGRVVAYAFDLRVAE